MSSTEAQQVMKTFLKEEVIPKCEESKSKERFQKLSDKLTLEARKRAANAGITGQDKVFIVQAFNARSLGVIHDVHSQVLKWNGIHPTVHQRGALREQLVMNGRKSETANKVLLADSYVDLFIPIHTQILADTCTTNKPATKLTKQVSEEEKKKTPVTTIDGEVVSPAERMRAKFVGRSPPRPPPENIFSTIDNTDNESINCKNDGKYTTQSIQELMEENVTLRDDLAATKHQVSVMQGKLKQVQQELDVAQGANASFEQDLREQGEVFARPLALLGGATAKLAKTVRSWI